MVRVRVSFLSCMISSKSSARQRTKASEFGRCTVFEFRNGYTGVLRKAQFRRRLCVSRRRSAYRIWQPSFPDTVQGLLAHRLMFQRFQREIRRYVTDVPRHPRKSTRTRMRTHTHIVLPKRWYIRYKARLSQVSDNIDGISSGTRLVTRRPRLGRRAPALAHLSWGFAARTGVQAVNRIGGTCRCIRVPTLEVQARIVYLNWSLSRSTTF